MVDTLISISLGIGLAAACGFRVFVPMLIAGLVARTDYLTLSDNFEWISSWPAIGAFAVAAALEVGAYYLPWLDNLLDAVAAPAAMIAGVILTAAFIHDMHPLLKWSLAIIAGGGAAGTVKTGLAGVRLSSTALTAGGGNPIVSTFEWIAAIVMSVLSIVMPIVAAIVAILLVAFFVRFALRFLRWWRSKPDEQPDAAGGN